MSAISLQYALHRGESNSVAGGLYRISSPNFELSFIRTFRAQRKRNVVAVPQPLILFSLNEPTKWVPYSPRLSEGGLQRCVPTSVQISTLTQEPCRSEWGQLIRANLSPSDLRFLILASTTWQLRCAERGEAASLHRSVCATCHRWLGVQPDSG